MISYYIIYLLLKLTIESLKTVTSWIKSLLWHQASQFLHTEPFVCGKEESEYLSIYTWTSLSACGFWSVKSHKHRKSKGKNKARRADQSWALWSVFLSTPAPERWFSPLISGVNYMPNAKNDLQCHFKLGKRELLVCNQASAEKENIKINLHLILQEIRKGN